MKRSWLLLTAGCIVLTVAAVAIMCLLAHGTKQTKTQAQAVLPQGNNVPLTREFAVPVLMYHRISDLTKHEAESPLLRDMTVSPRNFDEQVRYLVENGFAILTARQVEEAVRNGTRLPERAVALTMDDGYQDNFEEAFPVLRKYGLPATIFIVTSKVNSAGHLRWDEMLVMQRGRIGYGSHTVHHYDLTTLPQAELDYELRESKIELERTLGCAITSVAYPAGEYNQLVADRTKAAGYLAGWKKGGGPVQPGDDMFMLPRVRVRGCTTLEEFKRKVWSGLYARKMKRSEEAA